MIYHILRIIAYLLTFVALNLMYAGIGDGFKNGIINNDGWIPTFSLIFLLFIVSISTIILCSKKIKKINTNSKWKKWLYLHNYLIINYLPIQKFEKIFPNISSFVICPVISPIESIAFLKSIDNKSPVIPFSIPFLISLNDNSAWLREL